MKENEKCKQMSPNWPKCLKWFSRYLIPKSEARATLKSAFCGFSPFLLENDVTNAFLQNDEKIKEQYLGKLLFHFFEILHDDAT